MFLLKLLARGSTENNVKLYNDLYNTEGQKYLIQLCLVLIIN